MILLFWAAGAARLRGRDAGRAARLLWATAGVNEHFRQERRIAAVPGMRLPARLHPGGNGGIAAVW
jgi:hypothetical protein